MLKQTLFKRFLPKTLLVIGVIFLLLNVQSCIAKKEVIEGNTRPNIVLFLADDMTWRDCSPYGNNEVQTPNIQKLADDGISLDNMFTSTAMCAPTRQQILTGLFPVRSGAFPNHSNVYNGVKSLAHHFGDIGYHVAVIGKQHYGPKVSYPMEYLGGRQHDSGKDGADIDLSRIAPIVTGKKPFFIIIAQNQPHSPWNRGNKKAYNESELTVPEYMVDTKETRSRLAEYYAEITYMDSLLGKTLDYVDLAGKTKNTISIFTSEQGNSFPFAKWTNYDLGLKTAFIAKWPGKIQPGTRNPAMTQYVDILPTLLEAVGEDPYQYDTGIKDNTGKRGFDGYSFLNVLLNQSDRHREYVYGAQTTRAIFEGSESYPIRSIRSEQYKYIRNLSADQSFYNTVIVRDSIYDIWLREAHSDAELKRVLRYKDRPSEELYDIQNDPYELNNLVGTKYNAVRDVLGKELDSWMEQQGDLGVGTEMMALERSNLENWKSYTEKLRNKQAKKE